MRFVVKSRIVSKALINLPVVFWTGSKFNNTGDNFTSNIFSGFHFCPVGLTRFPVLYPSKNRTWERLACKKEIYLDLMFCKYLQLFHRYLGRCQSLGQHAKLKSVYPRNFRPKHPNNLIFGFILPKCLILRTKVDSS